MEDRLKGLCRVGFWLMVAASPFLDLINGIWTYLRAGGSGGMLSTLDLPEGSSLGPSLVIRLVFLALMLCCLIAARHKRAIIMFAAIGLCWLGSLAYELFRGEEFSIFTEIEYIVRFCYCLMCLVMGEGVMRQAGEGLRRRVDKLLCIAALTAALGVLVPYLFEIGFYTYADPLGYRGSRGFYYAGNDITVVMMLILPLMLTVWMEDSSWRSLWGWLRAVSVALSVVALLIIGTKTAFVALAVIGGVMLVYAIIELLRKKDPTMLLRYAVAAVLAFAVFRLLSFSGGADPVETVKDSVAATGQYAESSGAELVVFSGRTYYLKVSWAEFKDALPLSALVGTGRAMHDKIIEMDIIEVAVYYGVLGLAAMLWLYLTQGVKIIIDLFRRFSLRNLACCTALGLCVGFLVLAGHVLFSVTAGFYFAFMLCYTRMDCSKEGLDARII